MSYLFFCHDCGRYLNSKLYSKECNEKHIAPDRNSCAHKCKCGGLFKNCRRCNPYNCACGRVVANNRYTIAGHELTKYHIWHMKKNLSDNIT